MASDAATSDPKSPPTKNTSITIDKRHGNIKSKHDRHAREPLDCTAGDERNGFWTPQKMVLLRTTDPILPGARNEVVRRTQHRHNSLLICHELVQSSSPWRPHCCDRASGQKYIATVGRRAVQGRADCATMRIDQSHTLTLPRGACFLTLHYTAHK